MGAMLTMLLLLVACASEDDQGAGQPLRLVNANLTLSAQTHCQHTSHHPYVVGHRAG